MKRLLTAIMIMLFYGSGLTGCGTEAGSDAIVLLESTPPAGVTGPEGATFNAAGDIQSSFGNIPVLFRVEKSDADTTPVPDANIALDISGSTAVGIMYTDAANTHVAGNGGHWETTTDDQGQVTVYPAWTFLGCGSATENIEGGVTLTASISASQVEYVFKATLSCPSVAPP
jgi:hypothetical protein